MQEKKGLIERMRCGEYGIPSLPRTSSPFKIDGNSHRAPGFPPPPSLPFFETLPPLRHAIALQEVA